MEHPSRALDTQVPPTGEHGTSGGEGSQGATEGRGVPSLSGGSFGQTAAPLAWWQWVELYGGSARGRSSETGVGWNRRPWGPPTRASAPLQENLDLHNFCG